MNYRAREPKFMWILLFILTITYAYVLESNVLTFLTYGLSFVFFAGMTLSYQLEVKEHELVRVVKVFGFILKKSVIQAAEIEKLDVVQIGKRKVILLYLKKKMRLKFQRYSPEGLPEELLHFAKENTIKVVKTGHSTLDSK